MSPRKKTDPLAGLPSSEPVVTDVKSCEAWLTRAALADARQATREITSLLETFEQSPPSATVCVPVLERLREPIFVAQAEQAKRFSGRPLPLKDVEITAFDEACDLWIALGRAYQRLLQAATKNQAGTLQGQRALLAQRSLDCVGELVVAHYRARRELDSVLWQSLHELFRTAEESGVALKTVSGGYRSKSVSTCTDVYVRALLLALANPYSLGLRELGWTRRWAAMWAYKVDLGPPTNDFQGYAVNLAGDGPPAWLSGVGASSMIRFLDTSALRRSLRIRIKKLDAGEDPQTLGLGKDCVQADDVHRLLMQLNRAWIDAPAPRHFTRRSAGEQTELASGVETIHVAVSGKTFKSAVRHWDYSRREAEQIHLYQGVGGDAPGALATEKWETLDESATGFRLRRKGPGERLYLGQLVAVRPDGARAFILSDVRWLMTCIDASITIGAAAMPGLATGVAIRPVAAPGDTPEPYRQAFLLPNAPAQPSFLVLPPGWFQSGRELELRDEAEALKRVNLTALLQRGYDYDLASFKLIGAVVG